MLLLESRHITQFFKKSMRYAALLRILLNNIHNTLSLNVFLRVQLLLVKTVAGYRQRFLPKTIN